MRLKHFFKKKKKYIPKITGEILYGYHSVLASLTANKRKSYHHLYLQHYDTKLDLKKINKEREKIYNILKKKKILNKTSISFLDKKILNKMSNDRPHNGYILDCQPLYFPFIKELPYIEDFSENLEKKNSEKNKEKTNIHLLLDSIYDPQNLGSICRNSYFFGIKNIILSSDSCKINNTVHKVSSGCSEFLNFFYINNTNQYLNNIKNNDNVYIIGLTVPDDLTKSRNNSDYSEKQLKKAQNIYNFNLEKKKKKIQILLLLLVMKQMV